MSESNLFTPLEEETKTWRGRLRLFVLRFTRDPIMARVVRHQEISVKQAIDELQAMESRSSIANQEHLDAIARMQGEVQAQFNEAISVVSGKLETHFADTIAHTRATLSTEIHEAVKASELTLQRQLQGFEDRYEKSNAELAGSFAAKLAALKAETTQVKITEQKTVPIHEAGIGDQGEIQLLRQKLSALQTRVDVLSVSLSETRADLADLARGKAGVAKIRA